MSLSPANARCPPDLSQSPSGRLCGLDREPSGGGFEEWYTRNAYRCTWYSSGQEKFEQRSPGKKGGHDAGRSGRREELAGRERWRRAGRHIVEECGQIGEKAGEVVVCVSLNWLAVSMIWGGLFCSCVVFVVIEGDRLHGLPSRSSQLQSRHRSSLKIHIAFLNVTACAPYSNNNFYPQRSLIVLHFFNLAFISQ